jgi:hypothetical protein
VSRGCVDWPDVEAATLLHVLTAQLHCSSRRTCMATTKRKPAAKKTAARRPAKKR